MKNIKLILAAVVAVIVIGMLVFFLMGRKSASGISTADAGKIAMDFINKNIASADNKATLKSAVEENGLFKITFDLQGKEESAYLTKDGNSLFPMVIDIKTFGQPATPATADTTNTQPDKKATCDATKKVATPLLEAYVVSGCPYGLQMQRVLAEVIKNAPALKETIKVRYIGEVSGSAITSMHGDAEATENLRQICLREETSKYWDYVSCYMKKGDTAGCLTSTGVDKTKLDACMKDVNKGVKYAKADFDLATKNSVSGSPTLFLNGAKASEYAFGGRTADAVKSLICCGYSAEPAFCTTALGADAAATGFSETFTNSGATTNDASCGN